MGRYIERSEHISRYMNVNYFSSLDAPNDLSQSRQFVLRSLLYMAHGTVTADEEILNEEEVLQNIALNKERNDSLINYVQYARENAHSARDLISTELYESINKFYHFVLNYPTETLVKGGLYDFTVQVAESTSVLRSRITGTLLQDDVFSIIMAGLNLERAMQVIRIIESKYNDARQAKGSYGDRMKNSYEWTTLLKCVESYDMMRRFYRKKPTSITSLEFLILNPSCPRSIINSLQEVSRHIRDLSKEKIPSKDSAAFLIGKVKAEYEFKLIEEIEGDMQSFLENIQNSLVLIGQKIEKEYFNY